MTLATPDKASLTVPSKPTGVLVTVAPLSGEVTATAGGVLSRLMRTVAVEHYPNTKKILNLANTLPLVLVDDAVGEIVESYIRHKVMPEVDCEDRARFRAARLDGQTLESSR